MAEHTQQEAHQEQGSGNTSANSAYNLKAEETPGRLLAQALPRWPTAPSIASTDTMHEQGNSHCRPRDWKAFANRLQSYKPKRWFAKPQVMSPVNCARRGFVCCAVDELKCESCDARVRLPLAPGCSSWHAQSVAERTAPLLREAHAEWCGWRSHVCPPEIADFPPLPESDLRKAFSERAASFIDTAHSSSCVPHTTTPSSSHIQSENLPARAVREVQAAAASNSESQLQDAHARAIALLAALGWSLSQPAGSSQSESTNAILSCGLCGMRAGLWHFKLLGNQEKTSRAPSSTSTSRAQEIDKRQSRPQQRRSMEEADARADLLRELWHSTPSVASTRRSSTSIACMPSDRWRRTIAGGILKDRNFSNPEQYNTSETEAPLLTPAFGPNANVKAPLFGPSCASAEFRKGVLSDDGNRLVTGEVPAARSAEHINSARIQVSRDHLQTDMTKPAFDAQMQHRYFCPWICSHAGGEIGYLRLLRALSKDQKRSRQSTEGSEPSSNDDDLQTQQDQSLSSGKRARELLGLSSATRPSKVQRFHLP